MLFIVKINLGGGGGGGMHARSYKLMRRGVMVVKTTNFEGNDRPKIEAVAAGW